MRAEASRGSWPSAWCKFALLLPGASLGPAAAVTERLCARLEVSPVDWQGRPIAMTASYGWAGDAAGVPLAALLERADVALYRAKAAGRNRVQVAVSVAPDAATAEGAAP